MTVSCYMYFPQIIHINATATACWG